MTQRPGRTTRRLSLATTLLGVLFLLSCQQDGLLGDSGGAQPVAIAPRITVAPSDTAFFRHTVWVRASLQAGAHHESAWVAFDVGQHVFPGVPVNTAYTLTFEGFLADSTTPMWKATTSGTTGTTTTIAALTANMAPTPLFVQNGEILGGGEFEVPQTIEILTCGVDSVRISSDRIGWSLYENPVTIGTSGTLHAQVWRGKQVVATRFIHVSIKTPPLSAAPVPTLSPNQGTVYETQQIAITATGADHIEYSWDKQTWVRYAPPLALGNHPTIYARSILARDTSDTSEARFTLKAPKPVFQPDTGTFNDSGAVVIQAMGADTTEYSLGGEHLHRRLADTITAQVRASGTVRAISRKRGMLNDTASRTFTVVPPRPALDLPAATYGRDIQVLIRASGTDSIEYWSDDAGWTRVPGPEYRVTIWKTTMLQVRTFRAGTRSELVSGTYVIDTAVGPSVDLPLQAYGTARYVTFHSSGADSIQRLLPPFLDATQWRALPVYEGGPIGRDSGIWRFSDTGTIKVRAFKHGIASRVFTYKFPYSTFGIPWKKFGYAEPGRWGTLHDPRDGRVYTTININGRAWMAQNLAYDGGGANEACIANSPDSCEKYGRLYSWSEAMGLASNYDVESYRGTEPLITGICPVGWRIPTRADFDTLMMERILSNGLDPVMLKSLAGWSLGKTGIDSLGFRLLPAGALTSTRSVLIPAGTGTLLWSTDQTNATLARSFSVLGADAALIWPKTDTAYQVKKNLHSVRCIQMLK